MTDSSDQATLPAKTRIGRTALRVTEIENMVEFYRSVVGLTVRTQSEQRATLGVDGSTLLVLEADADAPARQPPETGLFHTAFRVPSRSALGDALGRVREHWHLDGASNHLVSEALYLTDPEGNGIEIYRDFPRDAWPRTADGRIRMTTEPLALDPIADAAAGDARAPPGSDVGHVHLEVSSLAGFRDVYVDAIGFPVQATMDHALFVGAGGYHHHLGANTWNKRTDPVEGRGLAWFEVVVPAEAAVSAVRRRIDGTDFTVSDTDEGFAVHDSDGIEMRIRSES